MINERSGMRLAQVAKICGYTITPSLDKPDRKNTRAALIDTLDIVLGIKVNLLTDV